MKALLVIAVALSLITGCTSPSAFLVATREPQSERATRDGLGFSVLYQFSGQPGTTATDAGVTPDAAGDLFGTTFGDGTGKCGTVYELSPSGSGYVERPILNFVYGRSGCAPTDAPLLDSSGELYVTAQQGGRHGGGGTALGLLPADGGYREAAHHSFGYGGDGLYPTGSLLHSGGRLYATTYEGGTYNYGSIVAVSPRRFTDRVVFSFDVTNGEWPVGALVSDSTGALYGATSYGGATGDGTVFKFVPRAGGGAETVIWNFDGGRLSGTLFVDGRGVVYGTAGDDLFALTPGAGGYSESVLHHFSTFAEGLSPTGLVALGNYFYGTTFDGGDSSCGTSGCGAIFRISRSGGNFEILHLFESSDGANPTTALSTDGHVLYGTTSQGGASGDGVIFEYAP